MDPLRGPLNLALGEWGDMMLLGVREDFAIECIHEPKYANDHSWVFGRMCVWCRGVELGDFTDPACMLNVTEGFLQDCLGRLDQLHDEAVDNLPDYSAFQFLDAVLYLDDNRSNQQIHADWLRFSKFNFLINWGESFDGTKAFLVKSGHDFRVLYRLSCGTIGNAGVTRDGLVNAILAFLEWMAIERRSVPIP